MTCHRFEGQPYVTPVIAPLPEVRLDSEVPAFQTVGLDYCGQVYLKSLLEDVLLEDVAFPHSDIVSDNAKAYKGTHCFLSLLFK